MRQIRLGVLCPSEIAFRRFMPALTELSNIFEYVGVAHASAEEWYEKKDISDSEKEALNKDFEKARNFVNTYGGKIFDSYESIVSSKEIDALYIPLPPALHYKWARRALEENKHVFLEKPSTDKHSETMELCNIAKEKKLALHENYMFIFHKQLQIIKNLVDNGEIGEQRLIRIAFGFPFRGANDFRYSKKMGGGALLDCGGYTLKLADYLLGDTCKLCCHKLNYRDGFEVDIYGSGTLMNDNGDIAQVSFGMDNSYKCELEIWGSKGCLKTNRILTAPVGFEPEVEITLNNEVKHIKLASDDSFRKSIEYFAKCIKYDDIRNKNYQELIKQSKIVEEFKE